MSFKITHFILVLFMVILGSYTSAQAQPPDPSPAAEEGTVGDDFYNNTYFAIGLNAGLVSGAGLSGRMSFPNGFSLQATTFIITLGDLLHFNIGAEGQYAFARGDDGRLFAVLGAGYYLTDDADSTKPGNRIANPFRAGLGIGYEWFTSRNFVLSLSGTITYFPTTSEFLPLPEFGMYYYFR